MTVSAIARFTITHGAHLRYRSRFANAFQGFAGALLAADESPTVEEGSWPYEKVIPQALPDDHALRTFADSPEYPAIAAEGIVLTVHGLT